MSSLHTPSGWKWGQKKRAELLSVCSEILEKSKRRESIAPQTQNGPRWITKKRAFSLKKKSWPHMLSVFEKHVKMCWCSFFSVHLLVFLHFLKWAKIRKNRKNVQKIAFFPFFPYALRRFFQYFSVIQNAYNIVFCDSK